MTYELNAYTDAPEIMPRIYGELHQNIQNKFNEAGVEIMSPHYTQVRDGNRTTIPANFLPPITCLRPSASPTATAPGSEN